MPHLEFKTVIKSIYTFLEPILDAVVNEEKFVKKWSENESELTL